MTTTDLAMFGGGIVGLATAYRLLECAPKAERGLRYDDPAFGISWPP